MDRACRRRRCRYLLACFFIGFRGIHRGCPRRDKPQFRLVLPAVGIGAGRRLRSVVYQPVRQNPPGRPGFKARIQHGFVDSYALFRGNGYRTGILRSRRAAVALCGFRSRGKNLQPRGALRRVQVFILPLRYSCLGDLRYSRLGDRVFSVQKKGIHPAFRYAQADFRQGYGRKNRQSGGQPHDFRDGGRRSYKPWLRRVTDQQRSKRYVRRARKLSYTAFDHCGRYRFVYGVGAFGT